MNGRNGYDYGYSDAGRSDRYDGGYGGLDNSGGSMNGYGGGGGSSRDRRPGGWGGVYEEPAASRSQQGLQPSAQPAPRRDRDRDPSARRRNDREDTGYDTSRSRERNRSNGAIDGNEDQQIQEILRGIQQEWDFMGTDDCIPIQIALQLMDSSTLGRADREPEFLDTHARIQNTLKSIVNEHHQGFNSSIGTYHTIQSNIQSSQGRVRLLRHSMAEAKSGLLTTKPELKGLATSSRNYDEILQLFGQIENIQSLPETLEARISEKRFLAAVEVLQEALRLIRKSDLEGISGLGDLRTYFTNQESSLTDILIEELHDHLYLKSPYCQDRWKPPTPEDDKAPSMNPYSTGGVASWDKPIYKFLANLDTLIPLVDDASRNPEVDTFYYIQMIIEALNKMGHLNVAVDRIEQRLPVELFAVVDKTNSEVDARNLNQSRGVVSKPESKSGLPTEVDEDRGHILSEFLWSLYAKFEAIAEGHRVVHDVVTGIVDREGLRKPGNLTGGFKELWKLYQSEIRSLLHDYLATDGDSSFRSGPADPSGASYMPNQRDRNKRMFKLSDVDMKSSEMKAEQDDLEEILRASVPGLVSKSRQKASGDETNQARQGNSGTGHKLLLKPSVFNMSLLLPPSLLFISRLKDIVPLNSDIALSTFTSFLDDFLINVFQPQLDEAATELCTVSLISLDAFMEHPQWARHAPKPIFKGVVDFFNLIKAFSKMLDSIPHDQMFTRLIISQIVTYYDKCCGWYKALVSRLSPQHVGGVRFKAAAGFADSGEIRDVAERLWQSSDENSQDLIKKEIELLLKSTKEPPLQPYDIVSDPKTVVALSLLYNSMQWLIHHLSRLRYITPHQVDSSQTEYRHLSQSRRWTLITGMKPKRDSLSQPVHLPMTKETVQSFDSTVESLRTLAQTALFTLQIDIRCGVIHMLTRTLAGPNPPSRDSIPTTPTPGANTNWHHIVSNPPTSASSTILDLNNDLIAFDTNVSAYLGGRERHFIIAGLARLIDQAFVACTSQIGAMNKNGALRLQLDVLVLQQNLKNILINTPFDDGAAAAASGPSAPGHPHDEIVALPRSAKFLDWFLEGAERALDYAKEEKENFQRHGDRALAEGNGEPFTYDELKFLVELCFSEVLKGPRGAESREDFMAAKRASGDALLRLSEVMWDS